tara:strand:+ start:582 stop:791 length:210 start_codon:yes stop_codon:yes gene_type:complete
MITDRDMILDEMFEEMKVPLTQNLVDVINHFFDEFNIHPIDTLSLIEMWACNTVLPKDYIDKSTTIYHS